MADVVDTMFGWLLEIFEWIFKALLKVCGWILKLLWLGIKSLFSLIFGKKESDTTAMSNTTATTGNADSTTQSPSNDVPKMRSYDNLISDIEAIDPNDSGNSDGVPQDRLMNIELTGLLHNTLTYAQKARLLKKGEEKFAEISKDPIERGSFFGKMVSNAYALINHMTDNAVKDHADKYNAGLDPNNQEVELEPLGNYFIDIMNIVAAMYSPDGKASFNVEKLESVELPTWAGDVA